MTAWCLRVVRARWFTPATLVLIALNALLIGLETDRTLAAAHATEATWLHRAILAAFCLELAVRLGAAGRGWPSFLRDGWNLFDLLIVAASLVPAIGVGATVARVVRVLRVLRVVSVSPQLRLIVTTMIRSVPSLGHVGLLLGLLLYVYGVLGVHLFASVDPAHWGSLPRALLTLFQVLTLEGWVELQRSSMAAHPWAWAFYASFVLIAVFVVVNLFIAVVLNNLEQARRELAGAAEPTLAEVLAEVRALRAELAARPAAGPPSAPAPPATARGS